MQLHEQKIHIERHNIHRLLGHLQTTRFDAFTMSVLALIFQRHLCKIPSRIATPFTSCRRNSNNYFKYFGASWTRPSSTPPTEPFRRMKVLFFQPLSILLLLSFITSYFSRNFVSKSPDLNTSLSIKFA